MHGKIAQPRKGVKFDAHPQMNTEGAEAYQGHELADGSLDMKVLRALETDRALSGGKRREHDEYTIDLHDLAHLVHPTQQNAVNLGHSDRDILDKESDRGQDLMDPRLGLRNGLGSLASDENLVRVAAKGTRGTVSIGVGEARREVDGSVGGRLDMLDVLPVSATQQRLHA